MSWLREHVVLILAAVAAAWIGYAFVRAMFAARAAPPKPSPTEQFERTEKVRQQIRRIAAERKANPPPALAPAEGNSARRGIPPIDPFGGARRRGWWRRITGRFGGR